jgi:GntP family gluconate:H+ symporter
MILILLLILSILFIVLSTTKFNLHPFLALLFASIGFGLISGMPLQTIVDSINQGFGGTIGQIGIVIIAGTIIGTFLEHSGGAYSLAERILKLIGKKRTLPALGIIGYIVSIPVFADSGFVILTPLNRALSKKAGLTLASTAIVLSMCLMISHNLVPPTPGPIAASGILEADIGLVLLLGFPVSLVVMIISIIFASKIASRVWIDPNPDLTENDLSNKLKEAPSALKSLIPILLPIILIVLKSISDFPTYPFGEGGFRNIISFIGSPIIALLIGVVLSFLLPKKLEKSMLSPKGWVGKGLFNAAIIIMITGAGGVFGKVLQNSGIADVLGNMLSKVNIGIWLPFILAAAIKTAQGSSTVSLITTASLLAPLLPTLGFESAIAKALIVLIIGSGAIVVSHANDSFFWVVTQMSDMDVNTGYRLHTLGSFVLGFSAAVFIWLLSLFLI